LLAGSAGPAGGVNALEIADAVHVVVPPRWSVTVTTPSEPLIVLDVVEANCDPSDTPAVGALIDRAPAVSVNVAGVAAPIGTAGRKVAAVRRTTALARNTGFRILSPFSDARAGPDRPTQFVGLGITLGSMEPLYQIKLSWFIIPGLYRTNQLSGIICRTTD
jgi:hypothetical protein